MTNNQLLIKFEIERRISKVKGLFPTKEKYNNLIDANVYWAEQEIKKLEHPEDIERYSQEIYKLKQDYYNQSR